jgi:uncharacterized protein
VLTELPQCPSSPCLQPASNLGFRAVASSHPCLKSDSNGVSLLVKVQPRAAMNQIVGIMGDTLRVRITAPPVDDAANRALIRFLADVLDCSARQIEVIRGRTSRQKLIRIVGLSLERVQDRLRTG